MALRSIYRQSFALEFQKVLVPEVLSAKLSHPVADMHAEGFDWCCAYIDAFVQCLLQLPALNMLLDLDTFLSTVHFTAICCAAPAVNPNLILPDQVQSHVRSGNMSDKSRSWFTSLQDAALVLTLLLALALLLTSCCEVSWFFLHSRNSSSFKQSSLYQQL